MSFVLPYSDFGVAWNIGFQAFEHPPVPTGLPFLPSFSGNPSFRSGIAVFYFFRVARTRPALWLRSLAEIRPKEPASSHYKHETAFVVNINSFIRLPLTFIQIRSNFNSFKCIFSRFINLLSSQKIFLYFKLL
jgi:hypothetical protein